DPQFLQMAAVLAHDDEMLAVGRPNNGRALAFFAFLVVLLIVARGRTVLTATPSIIFYAIGRNLVFDDRAVFFVLDRFLVVLAVYPIQVEILGVYGNSRIRRERRP